MPADNSVHYHRGMSLPGPELIERASLDAWPGIEIVWDRQWIRRASRGYTKRANSAQCFDPTDEADAIARIAELTRWFDARGLPPVVRSTPLEAPGLTAALDAAGWRTIDRSHVYAMALGEHDRDPDARLVDVLDPGFLAAQQALQAYSDLAMTGMCGLLGAIAVPAVGILIDRDGRAVASGLMAIADGIVLAGNVITDAAYRGRGLAGAVMRSGLAWARATGATIAALNVQADNTIATAFYRGLGYSHLYDYAYRVPR